MQICSWYTEHDKPLPGLSFDLGLFLSKEAIGLWCQKGPILGWGTWMGGRNGQRFLDRRRERPNKKAEAISEGVSFVPVLWTFYWPKGLSQG